ncbi:MAG: LodA/GoxA family CTQ-dependent oxidase [Nostoc sp. ChiQUE02]|uniref:LodA/GoxA family CTQ-dependent oxidase n=1 Tax=Nostoc sp. ChiQUE02 TaxID=3075377 RepID=UPI002AD2618D|nr:LodA/GoxA family CTQ-dependent oxidase [Nostoc sp. ChiQUE02]MDZ8228718.1 LodA/GoxA family CTQ-dependent oxidase [Nostoc sp. ChiQUE02]
MPYSYSIHPSIGVARVGNDPTEFFLAPNSIGGLPIESDLNGNELDIPFTSFKSGRQKDNLRQIRRQGQKFRIYRYDSDNANAQPQELNLNDQSLVESFTWTVHLANKKAAWYEFSELQGNLLLGEDNSYTAQNVPFRNKQAPNRKQLIIDPGPRSISGIDQSIAIDRNIPVGYPGYFPYPDPDKTFNGTPIEKLGDLKTDAEGRLIVIGGHGYSWGLTELSGYGGGDDWYDDTSDGSVTCTIKLKDKDELITLRAWVIVGPPDFAPEIANISSWDDTLFDVSVRHFGLVPEMYDSNQYPNTQGWNRTYKANYQRDILPIFERISRYHWVANVQSMIAFSADISGFSDPSDENLTKRQKYFELIIQTIKMDNL